MTVQPKCPTMLRQLCGTLEDMSVFKDEVKVMWVRERLEPAVAEAEAALRQQRELREQERAEIQQSKPCGVGGCRAWAWACERHSGMFRQDIIRQIEQEAERHGWQAMIDWLAEKDGDTYLDELWADIPPLPPSERPKEGGGDE